MPKAFVPCICKCVPDPALELGETLDTVGSKLRLLGKTALRGDPRAKIEAPCSDMRLGGASVSFLLHECLKQPEPELPVRGRVLYEFRIEGGEEVCADLVSTDDLDLR